MKRLGVAAAVCLLCVMVAGVNASPFFGIHSFQDWEEALGGGGGGGSIMPVDGAIFQDMVAGDDQWPEVYRERTLFFTPSDPTGGLYPIDGYEGEAGLVMYWQDNPDGYSAAAWDYVYGEDPDLSGATIEFSIFPPWPSTHFSLNLVDGNGNYREWVWHAPDPQNWVPGDPVAGQWNTLAINPATGTSSLNPVALFTHDVPGVPFDLSSINILRFDENIPPPPAGWPQVPPPVLPDGTWVYNLWNHVEVSPEPGTLVLVGSGLLGLWLKRRKKK